MLRRASTVRTAPRRARGAVSSGVAASALALLLGGLTACGTSDSDLTSIGSGLPSVTGVSVGTPDPADKDLPVDKDARVIEVTMEPDVGATQVQAVFDAYEDVITDESVGAVAVVLESEKRPRVAAIGELPSQQMVEALLVARDDPDNDRFILFTDGSRPRVIQHLRDVSFVAVDEHAEQHLADADVTEVTVASGDRSLHLVAGSSDLSTARARADIAEVVDADFNLLEARVEGSGDLVLVVAPRSLPAATVYVNQEVDGTHGKVIVQGG